MIILFLNKVDLLKRKLGAGVRFGSYVRSYERRRGREEEGREEGEERKNDALSVMKCELSLYYCDD